MQTAANLQVAAGERAFATPARSGRRRAIITGAGSGLGRAMAVRLARDGWHAALVDLHEDRCRTTLELMRAAGGDGQVERCDVAERRDWASLRDRLIGQWPQLDLLVNNAGVAGGGEIGQFALDDWDWLLSINLAGTIYGCHTFVDWLKSNPRGAAIINTASSAAFLCSPAMGAYNVSKAGVLALSETLAAELAQHNVAVTVLCPYFFQTNLMNEARVARDALRENATTEMKQAIFTAEDVAEAAVEAMHHKQLYVVMPRGVRRSWRLKRLLPAYFTRRAGRIYARTVGDPA